MITLASGRQQHLLVCPLEFIIEIIVFHKCLSVSALVLLFCGKKWLQGTKGNELQISLNKPKKIVTNKDI